MIPGPGKIPSNAAWNTLSDGTISLPGGLVAAGAITSTAPGSPSSPYSYSSLPTIFVAPIVYVANPLSPLGYTQFYWTGTAYKVLPDQILCAFGNTDGSPLLDLTATALTPGTGVEVWSSTGLIPDWMVKDGMQLQTVADFSVTDPSNTANAIAILRISDIAYTGSLDNNSALSGLYTISTTSFQKGPQQGFAMSRIIGGWFYASAGGSLANPIEVHRQINAIGSTATRKARLSFSPGAVTNRIRLYNIVIKSGAF